VMGRSLIRAMPSQWYSGIQERDTRAAGVV
jgi:hypothetical protein